MAVQYYDDETRQNGIQPAGSALNPAQWTQDTGRQSYHYQTVPEAYKNIPGFMDVANDPNADPGQFAQTYLQNQRARGLTDAGDADALSGTGALGGVLPKNATPAQQWNAQPAQAQSQIGAGRNELFQLLLSRAKQSTSVDRNDPNIRSQVDPYVAQQTRSSRDYLADVAEKQGPLGNLDTERRMASERAGQNAGLFEAEIIGREQSARRQEIEQALQLAVSTGNQEAALEAQKQLALLSDSAHTADRDLSRYQSNQGMDQFLRELALREYQYNDQSDLNWAQLGG